MKEKGIKRIILTMIAMAVIGCAGFIAGSRYPSQTRTVAASQIVSNVSLQRSPEKIAIVNLDNGVMENDKKMNYGVRMLEYSDNSNLHTTSLEEARQGVNNGRYAAYIIIPSTFSDSVVSINRIPEKTTLQYSLSDQLDAQSLKDICFQIADFEKLVNDNLGYLYVHSILDEFHTAQDNSKRILKNDKQEMEVLQSLESIDFIELVYVPEISLPEDEVKFQDMGEYAQSNRQLIDDIKGYFNDEKNLYTDELPFIVEDGTNLEKSFLESKDVITEIDITGGVQEHTAYIEALDSIETYISVFNQKQEDDKEIVVNVVTDIQNSNLNTILTQVLCYIQDRLIQIMEFLNGVAESVTEIFNIEITPTLYDEMLEGLMDSPMATDSNAHIATDSNANYASPSEAYQICPSDIEINYDLIEEELYDYLFDLDDIGEIEMDIVREIIEEIVRDNVELFVDETNERILDWWDEVVEWSDEAWRERMHLLNDRWMEKVNAIKEKVLQELELLTVNYPAELNAVDLSSITDQQQENYALLLRNLEGMALLEESQIIDVMEQELAQSLMDQEEEVKMLLTEEHSDRFDEIRSLVKLIESYDSQKDLGNGKFDSLLNQLYKNSQGVDSAERDITSKYESYISSIYKSVWDGMDIIDESVAAANETADQKMTENLDRIMTMKTTNSEINQSLVGNFINQLRYTRIGSSEYTQVYDFIVNPLDLAEVDLNSQKLLTQSMGLQKPQNQEGKEKETGTAMYLLVALIGLLSVTAVIRIAALVKSGKKGNTHPD